MERLRLLGVIVWLAVVIMATVGPSMAAPVTYTYQGPNFTSATGVYDTSMSISGFLTVDPAFGTNIDIFLTVASHPGLQDFSFTDGVNTITFANATDYGIRILTDGAGNIANWRVDLQKFQRDNPALPDNAGIVTCTTGKPVCDEFATTGTGPNNFGDLGLATNTTVIGTWSVLLPATDPTAQNKSNITAALQSVFNSATPGLLGGSGIPLNGLGTTNGNGITFAPTGLGFNRSSINSTNPLDREYGAAFQPHGYFAQGATSHRNKGFNFSVDMQGLMQNARAKDVLGMKEGSLKDGPTTPHSSFNSWASGRYVDFDDDETGADP